MSPRNQISPEEAAELLQRQQENWTHLGNVKLQVTVELGRLEMRLGEALALKPDDIIEIKKLAGEAHEIRVNQQPFAEGEVVPFTDQLAVRVTRMLDHSHLLVPTSEVGTNKDALRGEIALAKLHIEAIDRSEPQRGLV